ncbi:MAG TPA: DUF3536 domain-containing protein [Candidatus Saccharimonadales bacterium]|nr:DUF3536 domain-containing protein [Candidatus Saccharimonadales bacterium]
MSRPRLAVHGHFYQPPRADPFSGTLPADPGAAPARDWNARISAECYRPNALAGNLASMSWDLGPTLAGWLEAGDPVAYEGFRAGDAGANGMAQPFHHTILPLASAADRRTEVRWGLRDFEVRFGRRPTGMWLPETAVDLATLRILADEGITHTVLAPWQVDGVVDTRRPHRLDLGDARSMIVVLYDGLLSAAVSFEPSATADADRFVHERLWPRFGQGWMSEAGADDGAVPLVVIATDGELYGHHQAFREHFLARLVGATSPTDRGYDVVPLSTAVAEAAASGPLPWASLHERTSWSCHEGLERWSTDCACVTDGSWKAPLRTALERLAGGIDSVTDELARDLPGSPDPWAARDASVDVAIGRVSMASFVAERLGPGADQRAKRVFAALLEAQRWRLAMFASCGWFWEDPARPETAGALRTAVRASRLVDSLHDSGLERRLLDDLALVRDPSGLDGVSLLRSALDAVGQRVA